VTGWKRISTSCDNGKSLWSVYINNKLKQCQFTSVSSLYETTNSSLINSHQIQVYGLFFSSTFNNKYIIKPQSSCIFQNINEVGASQCLFNLSEREIFQQFEFSKLIRAIKEMKLVDKSWKNFMPFFWTDCLRKWAIAELNTRFRLVCNKHTIFPLLKL
jgi:hypothetical protein